MMFDAFASAADAWRLTSVRTPHVMGANDKQDAMHKKMQCTNFQGGFDAGA